MPEELLCILSNDSNTVCHDDRNRMVSNHHQHFMKHIYLDVRTQTPRTIHRGIVIAIVHHPRMVQEAPIGVEEDK